MGDLPRRVRCGCAWHSLVAELTCTNSKSLVECTDHLHAPSILSLSPVLTKSGLAHVVQQGKTQVRYGGSSPGICCCTRRSEQSCVPASAICRTTINREIRQRRRKSSAGCAPWTFCRSWDYFPVLSWIVLSRNMFSIATHVRS